MFYETAGTCSVIEDNKRHPELLGNYQTVSQFALPHPKAIGSTPFATNILFCTVLVVYFVRLYPYIYVDIFGFSTRIDEYHRLRRNLGEDLREEELQEPFSDLGPRWNDGPNDRFFSGLEFIKQCWVWKNHLMGYWKGTFPNTMDRHGPSWTVNQTFEERRVGWLSVGSDPQGCREPRTCWTLPIRTQLGWLVVLCAVCTGSHARKQKKNYNDKWQVLTSLDKSQVLYLAHCPCECMWYTSLINLS